MDIVYAFITLLTNPFPSRCSYVMGADGEAKPLTIADQESLVCDVVEPMASSGLRTICLAYKSFVKGQVCSKFVFLVAN